MWSVRRTDPSTCLPLGLGLQGAEEVKNKNAERVTRKIFSQAAWINLHMLPVRQCPAPAFIVS